MDTSEDWQNGNGLLAPLEVSSGRTYYILINENSSTSQGFTLEWKDEEGDSPVFLNCNEEAFTIEGGIISPENIETICIEDEGSLLQFNHQTIQDCNSYLYILLDDEGYIVTDFGEEGIYSDSLEIGSYTVRGVAYHGSIDGLSEGATLSNLRGNFTFSDNSVSLLKESCEAGIFCSKISEFINNFEPIIISLPYDTTRMTLDLKDIINYKIIDEIENFNLQTSNFELTFNENFNNTYPQVEYNAEKGRIIYHNEFPSEFSYIGQDTIDFSVVFPQCELTKNHKVIIDIECSEYEVNPASSDFNTARFRMTSPGIIIQNDNIDFVEALNIFGWFFQYKIEGVHNDWIPSSHSPTELEPNTTYAVFIRVVKANTDSLIFHGSNAEYCFTWLETPSLKTFPVFIQEDCSDNEEVILNALIEGLESVEDSLYKITWSTGDTTQMIQLRFPFEESYWVEVERWEDGCVGIDTVFHVGPPQINIDYPYASRCVATISERQTQHPTKYFLSQ